MITGGFAHNRERGLPRAQAYFMLDEMLIGGELQEPSKKARARFCHSARLPCHCTAWRRCI